MQLLRYFGDVGGKCRGKLTTVQWKQDSFAKYGSKSGKGGRLMNAEIGDKLKFYFNYRGFGTGSGHDVFLHPSGTCDTKGAKELANIKQLPFVCAPPVPAPTAAAALPSCSSTAMCTILTTSPSAWQALPSALPKLGVHSNDFQSTLIELG